jgi:hypothetical protein
MKSLLMVLVLLASVTSHAVSGTLIVNKQFRLKGKTPYGGGLFSSDSKSLSFVPGKHEMAFDQSTGYGTSEDRLTFVNCDGYCGYGADTIYFPSKAKKLKDGIVASYAKDTKQPVNIFIKYGNSEAIENVKTEAVSCKVLATCNSQGYDCRYKMGEQMANTHDVVKTYTTQIKFTDAKSNELVAQFAGKIIDRERVEKPYGKCVLFTE